MLKLYNTLTREENEVPENKNRSLKLFVCGPTVYDYAHIGHARTYIFFDFFAKYLRSLGYKVNYLQNITDIDDKIIKRAAEENKKPEELAKFYTQAYFEDMKALGVDAVSEYAPATKFIPQIIAQVERLIDKGCAYKIDGDGWYFDIAKFSDYGKLSGRTALQAEDAVSRIDEAAHKRNKGDFCLWKFSKPGEPVWKSKLGDGRPGWHIEDTAITESYFGSQYDIHGGGVDLKFPHHEAEIAQQESASGLKPFVKIWMHTGTLLADGKKMSKSLGNFITIRDFLKEYSANVLRWIVFSHHYRSPVDYNDTLVKNAEKNLSDLGAFAGKLEKAAAGMEYRGGGAVRTAHFFPPELVPIIDDDFNTQSAVAEIFKYVERAQSKVWNLPKEEAALTLRRLKGFLESFGISLPRHEIPLKIQKLADEREQFRSNKQFDHSDRLRKEIEGLGYDIEDTPAGPFIWPANPKH